VFIFTKFFIQELDNGFAHNQYATKKKLATLRKFQFLKAVFLWPKYDTETLQPIANKLYFCAQYLLF